MDEKWRQEMVVQLRVISEYLLPPLSCGQVFWEGGAVQEKKDVWPFEFGILYSSLRLSLFWFYEPYMVANLAADCKLSSSWIKTKQKKRLLKSRVNRSVLIYDSHKVNVFWKPLRHSLKWCKHWNVLLKDRWGTIHAVWQRTKTFLSVDEKNRTGWALMIFMKV